MRDKNGHIMPAPFPARGRSFDDDVPLDPEGPWFRVVVVPFLFLPYSIGNRFRTRTHRLKKYEIVATSIRRQIVENKLSPGEKLPSETELCQSFGFSRNAIRQALKNLAAEGWVESVHGVGTFCRARAPLSRLTKNIAFVAYYASSYVFPEVIRGCDHVLYKNRFQLVLNQSEYDLAKEHDILLSLRERKVDGIIIAPIYNGKDSSNSDLLEKLQAEGIAIVLCDNTFLDRRFSFVAMDDLAGGTLAADYLWEKGHRKIGVFFQDDYLVKIRRMEAVCACLDRKGAPIPNKWIVPFRGHGPAGNAMATAQLFFNRSADPPTAFVCSSDEDALQLIQAAEKQHLSVPADLSVISFDNSSVAQLQRVSLTSVDHPGFSMGELLTNIVLDKIYHPELNLLTRTLIRPTIVERDSVAQL